MGFVLTNLIHKDLIRRMKNRMRRLIGAIGAKYVCPVCGCRIRQFNPLPEFYFQNANQHGYRFWGCAETLNYQNYSCPICGASDRDRLYALYLNKYFTNAPEGTSISIVDFAPSAALSRFIRNRIESLTRIKVSYITADINMEGVDLKADITDLENFTDQQFDFFICSHILEHVLDDRKALEELYRILKPGGQGILMVPICLGVSEIDEAPFLIEESERWRRFGQHDHVRLYSKDGFIGRVKNSRFIIDQYGQEYFGKDVFARYGITNQSVLYVVEK